jgi:hypothetical protein
MVDFTENTPEENELLEAIDWAGRRGFMATVSKLQQQLDELSNGKSTLDQQNQYIDKARGLVLDALRDEGENITISEIYVVWFVKVLQNWKALVATSKPDDRYFEVTYNGDRMEAYIDHYGKLRNQAVQDDAVNLLKAKLNSVSIVPDGKGLGHIEKTQPFDAEYRKTFTPKPYDIDANSDPHFNGN